MNLAQQELPLQLAPPAVAVLFARPDSNYKAIADADVWDRARDARRYAGALPVVAHPPCRVWGRLRHLAKPRPDERDLALFAIAQVQRLGGVVEHPAHSTLWASAGLPGPGSAPDAHGGWTLEVAQFHWGHLAEKKTWLYIVGCERARLPEMPFRGGRPTHVIAKSRKSKPGSPNHRPELSHAAREHSPPLFAAWLCELARRCRK